MIIYIIIEIHGVIFNHPTTDTKRYFCFLWKQCKYSIIDIHTHGVIFNHPTTDDKNLLETKKLTM